MSETKFTKGEWFAIVDDECCFIDNCEKGLIADLEESDAPCDEAEANAHLIAAAPDMYEMLESLSELMPFLDEQTHPQIECDALKCDIDKLLEKARGEKCN